MPRQRRITTRPVDIDNLQAALDTMAREASDTAVHSHARAFVDVELAVWQMNMNEQAGNDLVQATYVLVGATIGLVLTTVALIVVTALH